MLSRDGAENLPVGRDPAVERGLALVHRLLALEVERMRAAGVPVGEDDYRGLYVSDAEADRLATAATHRASEPAEMATVREAISDLRESVGPLGTLAALGGLSPFEFGCVLLALASEVDLGVERLIGYVQDDVTKRRPRVDLAIRLLDGQVGGPAAVDAFAAGAPLRRLRLVFLHDEPGQPQTPLLARYVALDPRVAAFLQGSATIDEALHGRARLVQSSRGDEPAFDTALRSRLAGVAALPASALRPPVMAVSCSDAAGREAAARTIAAGSGLPLLVVDLPALVAEMDLEPAVTTALREGGLQPAAVLLDRLEGLEPSQFARVAAMLRDNLVAPLSFLGAERPTRWPGLSIALPGPQFEAQQAAWLSNLGDDGELAPGVLDSLAARFRLPVAAISDAVEGARGLARWRDPANPVVGADDLYAAARAQSSPILSDLARKVAPHYRWDDIILPTDSREQLREMCSYVENAHRVYESWGMARRLAMGRGLMALFAGGSGTGKTMAADVIAGELNLDLYKIDLSGVVSKYIGETEKNLSSIFTEAANSNAILFFDEADALFGKRSEVKDAHDRYANIETAYLLQRMEEYSGIVILATNLKMNIDEAFLRRLHFVVDFPMPGEEDRLRIWRSTIPAELPLSQHVDLGFMARQFRIAGGNIRNIVLAAAFLAASQGGEVTMEHMIRSVRREYQKLGRMITDTEFGPYVTFLRPALEL